MPDNEEEVIVEEEENDESGEEESEDTPEDEENPTDEGRNKKGQFVKKTKKKKKVKDKPTDTTKILQEHLDDLIKDNPGLDFSHLSVNDQIKTYKQIKARKDGELSDAERKKKIIKPNSNNPLEDPAEGEDDYVPLSKRNNSVNFRKKLHQFSRRGSEIEKALGLFE